MLALAELQQPKLLFFLIIGNKLFELSKRRGKKGEKKRSLPGKSSGMQSGRNMALKGTIRLLKLLTLRNLR